jgi:hypothetical protein
MGVSSFTQPCSAGLFFVWRPPWRAPRGQAPEGNRSKAWAWRPIIASSGRTPYAADADPVLEAAADLLVKQGAS